MYFALPCVLFDCAFFHYLDVTAPFISTFLFFSLLLPSFLELFCLFQSLSLIFQRLLHAPHTCHPFSVSSSFPHSSRHLLFFSLQYLFFFSLFPDLNLFSSFAHSSLCNLVKLALLFFHVSERI